MRLWPRTIRARDTLIATVVAACVLIPVAAGMHVAIREAIRQEIWEDSLQAAARVAYAVRDKTLTDPIPTIRETTLVQVVDARGRIVHATRLGWRERPLSTARPSADELVRHIHSRDSRHCHILVAMRVSTDADSMVVYAGREQPWLLWAHRLELLLGSGVLLLVALTGLSTWHMVGRTLSPIGQIRTQLAEITAADLSRRVPEPCGKGEIAELAHTANETIRRLERSVEQQRRFSSDASHELRTPIAALRAELESALMYPEDTDLVATLSAALRNTDRLEAVISDLLLLARLGTGGVVAAERIDLAEMVATELKLRPPSVLVGTDLSTGVVVKGVRIQLLRVLDNLLDNAERHGEGAIDVVVGRQEGYAMLMVTDRGKGIPESDRERAFERFTRLDSGRSRETGGTGLGLAIARDVAIAHGGTLRIEDSPHGARFVLRLPLAEEE
jgi:signal transduction histidine kinase